MPGRCPGGRVLGHLHHGQQGRAAIVKQQWDRDNAARLQMAGLISRPALATFMAWAGGQPFTLEISE